MATIAAAAGGAAQDRPTPAQSPAFRSQVDLVAVDATVVDRTGRPVDDLKPSDFRLQVNGKPRAITSAEFVAFDGAGAPARRGASSTNVGQSPGRLVMLVIDESQLRRGAIKAIVRAAIDFVDALGPSDRLALQFIPGAGPLVNFTGDHTLVKRTIENAAGRNVEADRTDRVGIAEALAMIERPVARGVVPPIESPLAAVMERECPGEYDATGISRCRSQLENLARSVYSEARARAISTMVSLREIVERLALTPDAKTLVLISGGMLVKDFADASWIEDRTAAASVGFYALRVDQEQFDASMARRSPSRAADRDLLYDGLDLIMGLSRGTVWPMAGNPSVTFDRLRLEISGRYLLSFAPEPGERDGRERNIAVSVTRPGLTVRARRSFVLDPIAAAPAIDRQLADVIRAPLLYADFGVETTTYSYQDSATGRVKVLVGAVVDPAAGAAGDIGIAYAVTGANGQVVAADVEGPAQGPDATSPGRTFTGSVIVEPGPYTVKVAAIGAGGRRGSVEHSFDARVQAYGQVRLGDLLVAAPLAGSGGVRPAVSGRLDADTLVGYTEVYSAAPAQLDQTALSLEVAATEEGRALASVPMRLLPGGADTTRRTAEGSLPLVLLPAGDYVARVVLSLGGRDVMRAARPVTIAAPDKPGGTRPAPSAPAAIVPLESRPEAFERGAILTRAVIGHALDAMADPRLGPVPPALTPAIGLARTVRLANAREVALGAAPEHYAARFLAGLADLAEGNLQGAAVHFGAALTAAPSYVPAAFYLGATYAAAGRDSDAVTAWQSSFAIDARAPWRHTLMADALLRLNQPARARAVMEEAAGLWPGVPAVSMRLAMALAATGSDAAALVSLDLYITARPDDLPRVLLGMQMIHDARAAGRTLESVEADRARFLRYFAIYERANGPELEAARRWKAIVEGR